MDNKFSYRYASHPRFSYWALNMLQRKRTLQQNSIFLKHNPGEAHLTIEELCEMALNGICENIDNAMEYVHVHEGSDKESDESGLNQEEWILIADYHNLHNFDIENVKASQYDWQLDNNFYSCAQIDEVPNWINRNKDVFETDLHDQSAGVNISCFTEMQKNAYDIIVSHCENMCRKNSLLMIINGVAGTGKSYLIAAVRQTLKDKCVITATTGKASFNISVVTIHSLLKLPVNYKYQKDLSGQSLAMLQDRLASIEYILIDEYSMLGQKSFGWIDR
ncbi:ATP-dependent DNA helicase PIF1 [Paramuricea clavata]|uniref:ATP-dependent DNA helicase n=1 Tax=Paramuricea clavata TaxID=317549 RepID=A0A6S7G9N4_PARCT|nr:ATP-dependent DNA helicase PIF1 [Paramuricea clavata]